MERFSETQYCLVVAAVLLTPMLALWIIEVIGWFLRLTLWRHPETVPRSEGSGDELAEARRASHSPR
jgi:hypothetical protein